MALTVRRLTDGVTTSLPGGGERLRVSEIIPCLEQPLGPLWLGPDELVDGPGSDRRLPQRGNLTRLPASLLTPQRLHQRRPLRNEAVKRQTVQILRRVDGHEVDRRRGFAAQQSPTSPATRTSAGCTDARDRRRAVGPGSVVYRALVSCEWLFIDGSSLIFRAYYGFRGTVGQADGLQTNAIRGFLERLARLIDDRQPRQVVVADDWAWRPDWRVNLIAGYKSHRVAEPVPAGLAPQLSVIYDLLEAIGVDVVGVADHEAEDVIATLTRLAPGTLEIASGDRDLFALVEDPRVRVVYPEKSGLSVIDEGEVTRRYGIPGRRYADFAILRGDPSDGLPGLKGVGSVTAAGMIRRYGDIAGVLRERTLREADRQYLEHALRVVTPVADLPIELPPGRRDRYPTHAAALESHMAHYDVRESSARLLKALAGLRPPSPRITVSEGG
jgi:5'-3' exonuclease